MSEELERLLKPLAHSAPTVARALDEAPELATKALAECTDGACEAKPEAVHQALMGLPIAGILTVLGAAEKLLGSILSPAGTPPTIAPEPAAKPPPGHIDQALGGERLTGWKTIIGIGAYVVVNVAAGLGIVPVVLTPDVVAALNTLIAGFIGVGLVAKLERYLGWLRPVR